MEIVIATGIEHFESGKQDEIARLFYKEAVAIKKRSQLVYDTVFPNAQFTNSFKS